MIDLDRVLSIAEGETPSERRHYFVAAS